MERKEKKLIGIFMLVEFFMLQLKLG